MEIPRIDLAIIKFPQGTEVFKKGCMNMEGFVLGTFWMLHNTDEGWAWELTCIVQRREGMFFIVKQDDLKQHKRLPSSMSPMHRIERRFSGE
jgi:hypothetical protein